MQLSQGGERSLDGAVSFHAAPNNSLNPTALSGPFINIVPLRFASMVSSPVGRVNSVVGWFPVAIDIMRELGGRS
jgi:hypothetical protein